MELPSLDHLATARQLETYAQALESLRSCDLAEWYDLREIRNTLLGLAGWHREQVAMMTSTKDREESTT